MKMTLIMALITLSQSVTFAAVKTYRCRNEARSLVTASLVMTATTIKMKFGSGSDGGDLEEDFKNKTVSLKLDPEASQNGWLGFTGDTLVNPTFSDYRTVEVRVETASLTKKLPIEMKFALSSTHAKNQTALSAYSYGMICQ